MTVSLDGLELLPAPGFLAQAVKLLSNLQPDAVDSKSLPVIKRLAKAAGVPLAEVLVVVGRNRRLPLAGFEASLHPAAPTAKAVAPKAEPAEPITARAAATVELLSGRPALPSVRAVDDAALKERRTVNTLQSLLERDRPNGSHPALLRVCARALEVGKPSDTVMLKRLLAERLTSGELTPRGLANVPAREGLEVVLRAAKATGVKPGDVRIAVGSTKASLAEVQELMGNLDSVEVVTGSSYEPWRDTHPGPGPRQPSDGYRFTSIRESVGTTRLDERFWVSIDPDMTSPYWGYHPGSGTGTAGGRPLAPPPPDVHASPRAPAAPAAPRYTGGYVSPWEMLAHPRAGAYFVAKRDGYGGGFRDFIR